MKRNNQNILMYVIIGIIIISLICLVVFYNKKDNDEELNKYIKNKLN